MYFAYTVSCLLPRDGTWSPLALVVYPQRLDPLSLGLLSATDEGLILWFNMVLLRAVALLPALPWVGGGLVKAERTVFRRDGAVGLLPMGVYPAPLGLLPCSISSMRVPLVPPRSAPTRPKAAGPPSPLGSWRRCAQPLTARTWLVLRVDADFVFDCRFSASLVYPDCLAPSLVCVLLR